MDSSCTCKKVHRYIHSVRLFVKHVCDKKDMIKDNPATSKTIYVRQREPPDTVLAEFSVDLSAARDDLFWSGMRRHVSPEN